MSDMFSLAGKVALVTGSTRGIGRSIAEEFARRGAKVVISSRKEDACNAVATEICDACGADSAFACHANISSKEDLHRLVATATERWGGVDILVCNAAINQYYGPMSGISDEILRKTLETNIVSNHWLIQMIAPTMELRGGGSIIIVSSIGGLRGSDTLGAYNISKAADFQLARNLAVELGPRKIRVNSIAPGIVRTDFSRALWENPKVLRRFTEQVPLRRMAESAEMAGAAVFLASDASSFVTGHTLVADGGATIQL